MRKVIKILVSTLSIITLSLLGLILVLTILLEIPATQNIIIGKAVSVISNRLGIKIDVGSVKLRFFNRARIEGLYVEDLRGDTLLYVGELDAGIRDLGFGGAGVSLGKVSLRGARFYMHQVQLDIPDSTTSNLGEILAKFRSDEPKERKGGFRLHAASLEIEDMRYRYRKLEPAPRPYGVNFQDVDIDRLDMRAEDISVIGDSIALRVKCISMSDRRSGFMLDELSASLLSVSNAGIRLRDLTMSTPDSHVKMNYLNLISDSWKSFGYFIDSVRMEADINHSIISYATIAYFAPGLKEWQSVYEEVTGHISGTVSDLEGRITRLRTRDTQLDGIDFALTGLPDVSGTRFRFDIGELRTDSRDVMWIMNDITGMDIPESTAVILDRLGNISFSGSFDGLLSRFKADGRLNTSQGRAAMNLSFAPRGRGMTAFDGQLSVGNLNLGALLANDAIGLASLDGRVAGTMGGQSMTLDADINLGRFDFNDYSYRDINMNGKFENRNFRGLISSADPNISFDFDGELDFNDSLPHYDFDLRLHSADLNKLNFNRRDSVSLISAHITAELTGNNPDNVNGHVDIDSLRYINHRDTIETGTIRLEGINNPYKKLLSLESSFADIQFQSRLGYSNIDQYVWQTIRTYIPTLNGERKFDRGEKAAEAGDYYLLKINVKEVNNLAQIFLPGLVVAKGTQFLFMLNPVAGNLSLSLQSEYIEWDRFFVTGLSLNSRNQGDSLSLFVRTTDFFAKGLYMPDFSVMGGVKDNRVGVAARFADSEKGMSALINGEAQFTETDSGMRQIRMRINPSYVTNREQTWRIMSNYVVYDSTRIDVQRLRIVSSNGELTANGVISRSPQDTIRVRLSNFNLQPLTQFTERMGYSISGISNGYANMAAAKDKGILSSDITFDSLRLNNMSLPPLLFRARWDFQEERAGAMLTRRDVGDTLARIFYRPNDNRFMGNVKLRGLDLSLIDPLLSGVLRDNRGQADVTMRITSGEDGPVLNGNIAIPSLTTTVDFTNVPYTLTNATVTVEDNQFRLLPTRITDPEGNSADAEGTFSPGRGFSAYSYQLILRPHNLMALSTTAADNDLFHGRVYASGRVTINGNRRGVSMDIAATTADNSSFNMSLSSRSGIGEADFITFVDRSVQSDSTWYQERKRQLLTGGSRGGSADNSSTIAINMILNVLPNTEFGLVIDPAMGRGIRARGNGALNISLDPGTGDFRMYGDYVLTEGTYHLNLERLIDRTFTIQPGSVIKWSGDPADATLDVTASFRLRASIAPLTGSDSPYANTNVSTECRIRLTDRLADPTISFEVLVTDVVPELQSIVANAMNTPELMSTQFLYLVALGRFYSGNTGIGSIGSMATGGSVFDILTNTLGNMLSTENINIGFTYRPGDEINSQEFGIDFSTSINQRLFLDIEGSFDTDNRAVNSNAGGLTGDFAFRYLIDRAGNLQAKFFSRTITTLDENHGLQETGIGIYYHEDFNTFREIPRNIRMRFSERRRKRKEREERERQDTLQLNKEGASQLNRGDSLQLNKGDTLQLNKNN